MYKKYFYYDENVEKLFWVSFPRKWESNVIKTTLFLIFFIYKYCESSVTINDNVTLSQTQFSNYISLDLDIKPIKIDAGYYISRVRGTSDTVKSVDIGGAIELFKILNLTADFIHYPESNNYKSNTVDLGIDLQFDMFKNYYYTNLGAKYSITSHLQKIYRPYLNTWEWRGLEQNCYTLSVSQDLPYNFYILADSSWYSYDRDLTKIAYLTYFQLPNVFGLVTSFPNKVYGVVIGNNITYYLDLSFSWSQLEYAVLQEYTNSYSINLGLYIGKFNTGLGYSLQMFGNDFSSGAQYINLSLGYKF